MYRCNKCKEIFDELEIEETTYESYYGVSDLFPNSTYLILHKCTMCHEENDYKYFNEEENEDEEEEYTKPLLEILKGE